MTATNRSTSELSLPVTYTWAKSVIPVRFRSAVFFFYATIVLFFAFGMIPNFLPVPQWVFNIDGVVLLLVVDWLCHRIFKGYRRQGIVQFGAEDVRLESVGGTLEHLLLYREIYKVQVLEGIPLTPFYFVSRHKTVVLHFVFKDGRTMKVECVKRAVASGAPDVETLTDSLEDRWGFFAD